MNIRTEAISESLKRVENYIDPEFEMHVYEKEDEGRIKLKLILPIQPKKDIGINIDNESFRQLISSTISDNFYLSSEKNLSDLIKT